MAKTQDTYTSEQIQVLEGLEAIRKSKDMMTGNKWKLFCLYFRFIGWIILCIITLGLAGLYVGPYMSVSLAKFYEDLKKETSVNSKDTTIVIDEKLEPEKINGNMTFPAMQQMKI